MAQILGTGKQRAGKSSRVSVGATNLRMSTWDVTQSTQDLDTVNFESSSFDEGISSILTAALSFAGNWDAGVNPYDDPPGIYPRDDLATVKFYENVTDNIFWSFPYMRVRSSKNGSTARGLVTFDASGNNQGTFTDPSGSV